MDELRRPPEFDHMFTDEAWASMTQDTRRRIVDISCRVEEEPTEEERRIHDELIVGGGSISYPPDPSLLPDDFEGPIESLGRPWRIFMDPGAVREVLKSAEEYHWQMERRDREGVLQGLHYAESDGCSTSGTEDVLLFDQLMGVVEELSGRVATMEKKQASSIDKVKYLRGENGRLLKKVVELNGTVKGLNSQIDPLPRDDSVNQLIKQCLGSDVIYLVGGLDDMFCPSSLGFSCFSPSLDVLIPMKPMPDERLFNSTVALDNRIFVLGGADHPYGSSIDAGADHFYVYLPKISLVAISALICAFNLYHEVCCYDTTSDDWTLCLPMIRAKANLAGVSLCGKIYAFGGGDGSKSFHDVEVFDPAYGKWIKNQPMLRKRSALAGVELNGAIYAVGGYDGIETWSCAERLDPREPHWKMLPSMNTQRCFHTLAVLDEKIYSIGGYNPEARAGVATVELYDPRMPSWVAVKPMKYSKACHSSAVECYSEGCGWVNTALKSIGRRSHCSAIVY
ncbi:kelch-like protein 8 isoform X2 [Triticum aestivum]|uniref:kelch-like protein 8 isoform X2 n=1 Tax=Triticum aestivum TaxID=4565 RepID=UPI001D018F87|nr:kelch-like protein 8 isoform X2 [Triticum aestivum]